MDHCVESCLLFSHFLVNSSVSMFKTLSQKPCECGVNEEFQAYIHHLNTDYIITALIYTLSFFLYNNNEKIMKN